MNGLSHYYKLTINFTVIANKDLLLIKRLNIKEFNEVQLITTTLLRFYTLHEYTWLIWTMKEYVHLNVIGILVSCYVIVTKRVFN